MVYRVTLATGEIGEVVAQNRRSAIEQFSWWVGEFKAGRYHDPLDRGIILRHL